MPRTWTILLVARPMTIAACGRQARTIDQQAHHRLALGVGDLVVGVGDTARKIREGRDATGLVGRHVRRGLFERVERLDVGLAFVDIDLEAELAQDGGQHAGRCGL